jgi:hypothetical protein
MIRVFRVKNDVDNFQYFLTENESDAPKLMMDGTPKSNIWSPPPVYLFQPKLQKGDFFNFYLDILISSPRATELLHNLFVEAGELLPLPYNDEVFTLLNVTECINCLDQSNTKWIVNETTNVRVMIGHYAFHTNRFSESCLFKIPETSKGEILVVEGLRDPKDEFRYKVDKLGLKGLKFQLLWEH